jgi:aquaporin Z
MIRPLREHWPEYLIEAAALGLFMVSAGAFGVLLEAPASPLRRVLQDSFVRTSIAGRAMGLTAVAIIYSPWGRRSGAHMNPAVTLTFLRLRKIEPADAIAYVVCQCLGGLTGVLLVGAVAGRLFWEPPVRGVATVPGPQGRLVAFVAELGISFALMLVILVLSNSARWARFTGLAAGTLVALFIVFEAPFSGMSINPARTLASAWPSGVWTSFWLYVTAPTIGMLLAAEAYRGLNGLAAVRCAKLHHTGNTRCIFRCGYCEHGKGFEEAA